jgi:hypothetical protein
VTEKIPDEKTSPVKEVLEMSQSEGAQLASFLFPVFSYNCSLHAMETSQTEESCTFEQIQAKTSLDE